MEKYRQYRMMKRVKKMLDVPVKSEDNYKSVTNVYAGGTSPSAGPGRNDKNPSHSLRTQQVSAIAAMLLQQIDRLDSQPGEPGPRSSGPESGESLLDIGIAFDELDAAMLFTDAEKLARKAKKAQSTVPSSTRSSSTAPCASTAEMRTQVEGWQRAKIVRQRKVDKIDTTIQDLGLNINDVRCAQILREKKAALAALESTIQEGVGMLRGVFCSLTDRCADVSCG